MKLFNKKTKIYCPTTGQVKEITQVNDEVFSNQLMGDGFAIEPKEEIIYAPIKGVITSIFPTKHAITIQGKGNVNVLIHIGLDTVELNGEGFEVLVNVGDKVDQQSQLAKVDFEFLKNKGKETDIIVVFPEEKAKKLQLQTGDYTSQLEIGELV